jgi:hypothetical protein
MPAPDDRNGAVAAARSASVLAARFPADAGLAPYELTLARDDRPPFVALQSAGAWGRIAISIIALVDPKVPPAEDGERERRRDGRIAWCKQPPGCK